MADDLATHTHARTHARTHALTHSLTRSLTHLHTHDAQVLAPVRAWGSGKVFSASGKGGLPKGGLATRIAASRGSRTRSPAAPGSSSRTRSPAGGWVGRGGLGGLPSAGGLEHAAGAATTHFKPATAEGHVRALSPA